jgi:predicted peroxiredoxin
MTNYNITINGVYGMDFLGYSEKLLLIYYLTQKAISREIIKAGVGAKACSWTVQGFNRVNKRLMERGFVKIVGHAQYSLNETNIF